MSLSDRLARRRQLLVGTCAVLLLGGHEDGHAISIRSNLPWRPDQADPPTPVRPGPWQFFTPEEANAVEALVDRLIPPDAQTAGGKDAGVAVFIDRQLARPYGSSRALYMRPPFMEGTKDQGPQSPLTPAQRYRRSLAALARYCASRFAGRPFREIPAAQQDDVPSGLEAARIQLSDVNGKPFFELLLRNTKEGFFADPIYGGNRNMVGWKMIGFPGPTTIIVPGRNNITSVIPSRRSVFRVAPAGRQERHEQEAARDRRRDHRPGLDRIDPRAGTDRGRIECCGD